MSEKAYSVFMFFTVISERLLTLLLLMQEDWSLMMPELKAVMLLKVQVVKE